MNTALALSPTDAAEAPRCAYQAQDSPQTLSEGLAEYYARNAGRVTPPDRLPSESAALFRSHDICHVIFGLDTTLGDETMADTRSLLSTDVGWRRYAGYIANDPAAKAIFQELGYRAALAATVRTLPRIARAIVEAARMRRPWPWVPPADYLNRRLADLRRAYGIRVI